MATVLRSIGTNSRDYSTISLWVAANGGGDGLGNDDCTGECYNDSVFDESVNVDFPALSRKLSVAAGERHDGTAGSGTRVVFSVSGAVVANHDDCIIEWMELDANANGTTNSGFLYANNSADNCSFLNNIVHGVSGGASNPSGISGNESNNLVVANNIVYGITDTRSSFADTFGIRTNSDPFRNYYIYNNTVFGITQNGGMTGTGIAPRDDNQHTAINNISTACTTADFSLSSPSAAVMSHNLSSDSSASGTGSLTNKNAEDLFVSTLEGFEDLSLKKGSAAVGNGADLSGTLTDIEVDASGRDRTKYDSWDIGAMQWHPTGETLGGETAWYCPTLAGNSYDLIADNNGTISGGVTIVRDREKGGLQCWEFDGVDGQVDIGSGFDFGDETTDQPFSMSAWVKPDVIGAFPIFNKVSGWSASYYEFLLDSTNKLKLTLFDSTGARRIGRVTTAAVPTGEWTHVAATYDASATDTGITLYINGEAQATTTNTVTPYVAMHASSVTTKIGKNNFAGQSADGRLDDARIIGREALASEIKELYKRGYQRRYAAEHLNPVLAIHPSEDKFGAVSGSTIAHDLSGNGNNGTLTGATYVNDSGRGGRKVLSFPATGDNYVEFQGNPFTDMNSPDGFTLPFAVSMFIKPTAVGTLQGIFDCPNGDGSNTNLVSLRLGADGNVDFYLRMGANGSLTSSTTFVDDTWYHLLMQQEDSSGEWSLWVNGVKEASGASNNWGTVAPDGNLVLGKIVTTTAYSFKGEIDGTQIFDYALSESEIRLLAQSRTAKYIEPEDGLVARLDTESDENAAINDLPPIDQTLNVTGITINGSATYTADTEKSGKYALDPGGVDGYVAFPVNAAFSPATTGQLTVSVWAKVASGSANTEQFIIGKAKPADYEWGIFKANNGSVKFVAWQSSGSACLIYTKVMTVNDDSWHHYVMTIDLDSGVLTAYIDGAQVGQDTTPTGVCTAEDSVVEIGRRGDGTRYFDGLAACPKIYSRALYPREVAKQYAMERPGVPRGFNRLFGDGVNNEGRDTFFAKRTQSSELSVIDESSARTNATWASAPTITAGPNSYLPESWSSNGHLTLDGGQLIVDSPFTLTGWTRTEYSEDLFWFQSGGVSYATFNASLNTCRFRLGGINNDFALTSSIQTWLHYAIVCDGDLIYLYENGTLVATDPDVGDLRVDHLVVNDGNSRTAMMAGYREALSSLEIQDLLLGPAPIFTGATLPTISPQESSECTVSYPANAFGLDPRWGAGTNGTVTEWLYWYIADDANGTNETLVAVTQDPAGYTPQVGEAGKYLRVGIEPENSGGYDPAESLFTDYTVVAAAVSNTAPVLANIEVSSAAYVEDGAAVAVTSTLTITDAEDANMSSAVIAITANHEATTDTLTFVDQNGIIGSFNSTTGVLSLTGSTTIANYETAIRSVTFSTTSNTPSELPRTVSFTVNDGTIDSNTVTRDITVAAANDEQQITTNTGATFLEGSSDNVITQAMLETTDPETAATGIVYTVNAAPSSGALFNSGSPLSGGGTFTQDDINNNLITYNHDGSETVSDVFTFSVDDGVGSATVGGFTLTITPVDDAPTLAGIEGTAIDFTEGDGPTVITSTATIGDADSANLASAEVAITGNYDSGNDVLAFVDANGITGTWNSGTGILSLSGNSTLLNYQTAIRSVTFDNTSSTPSELTRTVSFKVNDGTSDSNTVTRSINVTDVIPATPDDPLIRVPNYRNPYLIDFDTPFNANNPYSIPAPVAWWQAIPTKMGGTVFPDLMGNYDGTLTNMDPATDWLSDAPVGQWGSLAFDNTNDYVSCFCPDLSGLPFTFGLMVKSTASSNSYMSIANSAVENKQHRIVLSAGNNYSASTFDGSVKSADAAIGPSGNWDMVLFISEGSAHRQIAVNGNILATDTTASSISGIDRLTIGTTADSTPFGYLDGNVSFAFLFDIAFSASQVAALYEESKRYYPNLFNRKKVFRIGGETAVCSPTATGDSTEALYSGNDGTISGGVTIVRDREKGGLQCWEGDGTGSVALDTQIDLDANIQPWSVSFWAKRSSTSTKGMAIGDSGTSSYIWLFSTTFRIKAASGAETSASVADITDWNHYSVTHDGTTLRMYVNGVEESTNISTSARDLSISQLLNGYTGTAYAFAGKLDDVRITDGTCLNPTEIKELYKRGYQRRYAAEHLNPVLAIHPSEDKFGAVSGSTIAHDLSGNGNNGAITGATYVNDSGRGGRKALSFDGVDDYVDCGVLPVSTMSAITIAGFLRSSQSMEVNGRFVSIGHSNADDIRIWCPNGTTDIRFTMDDGSTSGEYSSSTDGNFHHYALTHDGTTQKVFIDGVEVNSVAKTFNYAGASGEMFFGALFSNQANNAGGEFDSWLVFDYALNESEIRLLAQSRTAKYIEPEDGLVAWYCPSQTPGDVANGDGPINLLLDGNNGTLNGTATYDTADTDKSGTAAFEILADGDCVTVQDHPIFELDSGTIQAWVKTTDSTGIIVEYFDGADSAFQLYLNANGTVRFYRDAVTYCTTTSVIADGSWHLVTASFSSSETKIYIDGTLESTGSGVSPYTFNQTEDLCIGGRPVNQALVGLIDNVKIYNRALYHREIAKQYAMERPGVAKSYNSLVGDGLNNGSDVSVNLPLQDGTAVDWSGRKRTPTINGAPTQIAGPNDWLVDALRFDGIDDYILAGVTEGSSYLTAICWASRPTGQTGVRLFSKTAAIYEWEMQAGDYNYATAVSASGGTSVNDAVYNNTTDAWLFHAMTVGKSVERWVDLPSGSPTAMLDDSGVNITSQEVSLCARGDGASISQFDVAGALLFERELNSASIYAVKAGPAPIFTGSTLPTISPQESTECTVSYPVSDSALDPRWGAGTNGLVSRWCYWYLADDANGANESLVAITQDPAGYTPQVGEAGKYLRVATELENSGGYDSSEFWYSDYTQIAASSGARSATSLLLLPGLMISMTASQTEPAFGADVILGLPSPTADATATTGVQSVAADISVTVSAVIATATGVSQDSQFAADALLTVSPADAVAVASSADSVNDATTLLSVSPTFAAVTASVTDPQVGADVIVGIQSPQIAAAGTVADSVSAADTIVSVASPQATAIASQTEPAASADANLSTSSIIAGATASSIDPAPFSATTAITLPAVVADATAVSADALATVTLMAASVSPVSIAGSATTADPVIGADVIVGVSPAIVDITVQAIDPVSGADVIVTVSSPAVDSAAVISDPVTDVTANLTVAPLVAVATAQMIPPPVAATTILSVSPVTGEATAASADPQVGSISHLLTASPDLAASGVAADSVHTTNPVLSVSPPTAVASGSYDDEFSAVVSVQSAPIVLESTASFQNPAFGATMSLTVGAPVVFATDSDISQFLMMFYYYACTISEFENA